MHTGEESARRRVLCRLDHHAIVRARRQGGVRKVGSRCRRPIRETCRRQQVSLFDVVRLLGKRWRTVDVVHHDLDDDVGVDRCRTSVRVHRAVTVHVQAQVQIGTSGHIRRCRIRTRRRRLAPHQEAAQAQQNRVQTVHIRNVDLGLVIPM